MKIFYEKKVMMTSLIFLLFVLLLVALTISTENILDLLYSSFLCLGFFRYLFLQKED